MNILDIYEKYKIMPVLAGHQLRVASVAKLVCDSIPDFPDTKEVVTTCLLHDMGNIIKFDLNYSPETLEPLGLKYWQGIKDEYIAKYGKEEHVATKMIITELAVSPGVTEYADQVGFSKLQETEKDPTLAKKICAYADMRVGFYNVITTRERLADGRKRYEGRKDRAIASDRFEALATALENVESQVCGAANIRPEDITEEKVAPIFEKLKDFEI